MINELHLTVSRYNGIQVSIEVKTGDSWHYIGAGYHNRRFDITKGYATGDAVDDTITTIAGYRGEEPARAAASNYGYGLRSVCEVEL